MNREEEFIWAVATAAYQVEGGYKDDGRGESMWDAIRKEPGRIADGSAPDLSCRGRELWREDVQLIKSLNVSHYRFSIDWGRVMADGRTKNDNGMDYYVQLCRELVSVGIKPMVTLFHADLPLCLYNEGSWLREGMVDDFVAFAEYCYDSLHPFASEWLTINEIQMHCWSGVVHFPGLPAHSLHLQAEKWLNGAPRSAVPFIVAKNMLVAHARVYRLFHDKHDRQALSHPLRIGIVYGAHWCEANDDEGSSAARDRAFLGFLAMFLHPVMAGEWPKEAESLLGDLLPPFSQADKQILKGSADLLAFNYYRPHLIGPRSPSSPSVAIESTFSYQEMEDPWERISGVSSWLRLAPWGLGRFLRAIRRQYGDIPILISENGCADLKEGETLRDEHRTRYIREHLVAIGEARAEGIRVIGYTAWSLMDNFEWDDGFAVRFGLFQVDFSSSERTRVAKDSSLFYSQYIRDHPMGPYPR